MLVCPPPPRPHTCTRHAPLPPPAWLASFTNLVTLYAVFLACFPRIKASVETSREFNSRDSWSPSFGGEDWHLGALVCGGPFHQICHDNPLSPGVLLEYDPHGTRQRHGQNLRLLLQHPTNTVLFEFCKAETPGGGGCFERGSQT